MDEAREPERKRASYKGGAIKIPPHQRSSSLRGARLHHTNQVRARRYDAYIARETLVSPLASLLSFALALHHDAFRLARLSSHRNRVYDRRHFDLSLGALPLDAPRESRHLLPIQPTAPKTNLLDRRPLHAP